MPPLKLAVSGYYGCGNAGDEAVLAGMKEALTRVAGERVQLLVLSQNPQDTHDLHGVEAVYRMHLPSVRTSLKRSAMLISGGGSLLQDSTSLRSLFYYLLILRMAQGVGIPTFFYAQGIGPLRRPIARWLVRVAAERAAGITVRDEPSRQLLKEIGVRKPSIEVTADPAFCLNIPSKEAAGILLKNSGIDPERPSIGVSLRPWEKTADPFSAPAALLPALESACGKQVILIPMQQPGDSEFALETAKRSGSATRFPVLGGVHSPREILGVTARMEAVVAMRLHTLIFAVRAGVPPFALSYDPKVENLMQLIGRPDDLMNSGSFHPEEVADHVRLLLAERSIRAAELKHTAIDLEQRALRTAELAMRAAGIPVG